MAEDQNVQGEQQITSGLAIGALILNLVLPGVGSLVVGGEYKQTGIYQLVLYVVGLVLSIWVVGIFIAFAAWVWALITSIDILKKSS